MIAVTNMDRGSLQAEFCSSSAKCTLESAPLRYGIGPFKPTKQASPVVGQPLDSNSVKTDEAVPWGARVLDGVKSISGLAWFHTANLGDGLRVRTKAQ